MGKQGIVVSIDRRTNTGIIRTKNYVEYFFYVRVDEVAPNKGDLVEFQVDRDFKSTKVAHSVRPLVYGEAI